MSATFDATEACAPIVHAALDAINTWSAWACENPHGDGVGASLQAIVERSFLAVAAGLIPTLRTGADEETMRAALLGAAYTAIEDALRAARAHPETIGSA